MSGFVERFWRGEVGWGGHALGLALAPAELAYRVVTRARNASFDLGVRVQRAPVPVVSVGSLRVGGAGKTPFARWAAEYYIKRGVTPGILHGGYADDEPVLHRLWNAHIPVVARRDRISGAREAARAGAEVLVMDDGFQHRRLARNLDIVLVPVESWTAHPHLLPSGPWRESPSALRRANIIVLLHRGATATDVARVKTEVSAIATRTPIVTAALLPTRWRMWKSGAFATPASGVAVAGIADPDVFLADARSAGGSYESTLLFRDHHAYTGDDAERIRVASNGRPVLTTEKDAVKLAVLDADLDLYVLEQELLFDDAEGALDELLDRAISK